MSRAASHPRTPAVPRVLRAGPWAVRAALLAGNIAAFILLIGLDAIVVPGLSLGVFAAVQTIAAIALVLAVVFIALARHRIELGWPTLLVAAAVVLQVASAWLRTSSVIPPGFMPAAPAVAAPAAPPQLYGFDLRTLAAALATLVCFGLMLIHASWVLSPSESRAPLRARLRASVRMLRFNPIGLLFGPVFQKEVRVAGRRRSTYVARTLYALLLLGIVSLAYSLMVSELDHVSGAARLQRLQGLAPQLAMVIAWCQFAVLSFLAPVMAAPSICDERRQLTLSALMTTPMSSSQIIFGKLTSRLVMIVILALISTPLLLAVRIYGGLEAEVIVATTAISVSAAVLGASLGVLYSVWHRRAATAAIFGLLTMFLFMAAVIVVVVISLVRTNLPPSSWIFGLSAPMSMFGVYAAMFEPGGTFNIREIWVTNTVVNLTLSVFACTAATLALRTMLRAEAAGALAAVDRPRRRRRAGAAQAALPDAPDAPTAEAPAADEDAALRTGAIRTVGNRPVLWRETRQASFGSRRRLLIVSIAVALGAGFIYSRVPFDDEALHALIGMIGLFVVVLQACVATTGSIAGEFESRTWHVLLTTTLSGREIVFGKFLGGLRRQWFVSACIAAHYALGVAAGHIHPLGALHLGMIIVATTVMLTGVGLLLSLLLRRSAAAGVASLLLALGLWLILPVGMVLIFEVIGYGRLPNEDEYLVVAEVINPFWMAADALEPAISSSDLLAPGSEPYRLSPGRVSAGTFTLILGAVCALGIAVGIGAATVATRVFRRVGGRVS